MLERLSALENQVAMLRATVATLQPGALPSDAPSPTDVPATNVTASSLAPLIAVAPDHEPATAVAPLPEPAGTDRRAQEPAALPLGTPQTPASGTTLPDAAIHATAWWARFWLGNPLAKIGVILLFFGVASGLKLVVEFGFFPVSVRLGIAALAGVALIVFGWRKAHSADSDTHRTFALAIQGGGIALLYLVVYFMLGRYAFISQTMAFALFALLGVICVALAAKQEGPALAVLGLSGAFLAPVLAGGNADTPLPLFSYFALLNAFILIVDWRKSWRVLNIAGFVFTLVIGMTWGLHSYENRHYAITQAFLILFLVTYSAMPVLTALLKAPGFKGWQDGMLLFGTPLSGAYLQSRLMVDVDYGSAWSALTAAVWYCGLWLVLQRRLEPGNEILERSQLGLAIVFLTIVVPLAFDNQVTSAFWALEGAAVLWYGMRTQRLLPQITALLMQLASGFAFLLAWPTLGEALPILNDKVLGGLLIAGAGLVSARLLRGAADAPRLPPLLPFVWALTWWFGVGLDEIERIVPAPFEATCAVLLVMATVVTLEGLAGWWSWPQIRMTSLLLLAALGLACLHGLTQDGHPIPGLMALVFPAAFALNLSLLRHHERQGLVPLEALRHLSALWLALLVVPAELAWQVDAGLSNAALWPFVIWALCLASGLGILLCGQALGLWPFARTEARYLPLGGTLPFVLLAMVLPVACFRLSGSESPLPYLPVLSAFDLTQWLALWAMWRFAGRLDDAQRVLGEKLVLALAFIWFSTLAARITHAWGGVPFELHAMAKSTVFQMLLTLCWTITSIMTMIIASRRAKREVWFAGFALLGVVGAKLLLVDAAGRGTLQWTGTLIGVAVLVLAASYFAPVPPREKPTDASPT
ncbi:MAG: DUF2339 domain-containing protein [Rhodocyclaceae bacterium]|nr:DUF2339 domain-containing protein [Rhodocyclaceae bacterium]